jgi:hypothetical protein
MVPRAADSAIHIFISRNEPLGSLMRNIVSMSHSLVCWRCGISLAALSLPLRRLDVCKACNAELHVCRMCVEYDTSYAKHCKEPTAEEVRKKDEANFCDHFKPRANAYVAKNDAEVARSKSALDDLFRK